MINNLIASFGAIWNRVLLYINDLYLYPVKIFSVVLDLFIVGFVIFEIIRFSKNTKVMQLIKGILIFVFIVWLSGVLKLTIVHSVLTAILPSSVIALVVLLQPEIRRGLEQIGTNKFYNIFGMDENIETKTKEDIYKTVIAVEELANNKTGALIVFERDIKLNDIISTGIEIKASISPQILVNIFIPNTPLHDGAVVVANNKIEAAACILPLANDREISKELGTRHRAAVGMSKESDAIVIVVSEESGKISIAKDGTLIADVSEEKLKEILIKNLITNRLDISKKMKKGKKQNISKIEVDEEKEEIDNNEEY